MSTESIEDDHLHILRDSRSQQDVTNTLANEAGEAEAWIAAWWIGRGETSGEPTKVEGLVHVYETHLRPSQPLEIARRVRIFALPKAAPKMPGANLKKYRAYDPHVVGVVVGMEKTRDGGMRVEIQNRCRGNTVRTVMLDIVHSPEETARGRGLDIIRDGPLGRLAEAPKECIAHFGYSGHFGHFGHPGYPGHSGVDGRSGGSIGGGRDGCRARNNDGDDGGRRSEGAEVYGRGHAVCGAEDCGLEPPSGYTGRDDGIVWKVMEKRVRKEVPRQGLEGMFRLHMWLKYDGAP